MISQNFIKHKVRPDDNLSSLAKRINISETDLKDFHNQNCGNLPKLWVNNLQGIEVVLIPTNFITEEEKQVQLRKLLPAENYHPNFHLSQYSVEEIIEQTGKEDLKINYTTDLNFREIESRFVVDVAVKDYTKNGNIPDDKISLLSLECMKSLYPISFQLSDNGKLESCYEHQITVEKFKSKRSDIEDFYIGEIARKYLNTFEQNISDEDYFLKQIQSALIHQILFPNLIWFHKKSVWQDKFVIYPNSFPLEFECKTENQLQDDGISETVISASLWENCSLRELIKGVRIEDENENDLLQIDISIHYFTSQTTKKLLEVKSSVSIWFQGELFQKHTLNITQN
ncbi:LysM peptidoglycan-binding domain-containing protein [Chryseobacterium sp. Leaf394]|uniref:LysM peptidoglycan-binding domain-containing protein n=1 Tax=Chryseobacterium sp. Leaf394 TaxID=1736361 RepID=UPI0006F1D391|nr:LysM peptidoglycan-binding domain-containing protein [Chryseobacterium sp. Leaf394]KQS94131.1 hypothetical protein ASG21_17925 [Chryseobacterium sp. Leaf394]